METNPNRVSLSFVTAIFIAPLWHTYAILAPVYTVDHAYLRLIPSFIRFFALFYGVFQCFHMHIRNRYLIWLSSFAHTPFILLDFISFSRLIRISQPYMRFLFVGPRVCLQIPSDSTSRWTPLLFSYVFPRCLGTLGTFTR